jgi:hypothetical protein
MHDARGSTCFSGTGTLVGYTNDRKRAARRASRRRADPRCEAGSLLAIRVRSPNPDVIDIDGLAFWPRGLNGYIPDPGELGLFGAPSAGFGLTPELIPMRGNRVRVPDYRVFGWRQPPSHDARIAPQDTCLLCFAQRASGIRRPLAVRGERNGRRASPPRRSDPPHRDWRSSRPLGWRRGTRRQRRWPGAGVCDSWLRCRAPRD